MVDIVAAQNPTQVLLSQDDHGVLVEMLAPYEGRAYDPLLLLGRHVCEQ
jgi:hypothetical protein